MTLNFINNSIIGNRGFLTRKGMIDFKAKNITILNNNFTANGIPNISYIDPNINDIANSSSNFLLLNPLIPEFGIIFANLVVNQTLNILNNYFSLNMAKYGSCIVITDSDISSDILGFIANINNNTFIYNQAYQSQIYINYNAKNTANFTMNNCYFERNNAYCMFNNNFSKCWDTK